MPYWEPSKGKWRGKVTKNGERRTGLFDTKREARAWEQDEKQKDWSAPIGITSLAEWAEAYLDHSARFVATVQYEKRLAFRRLFARHSPLIAPKAFTLGHAQKHLDELFKETTASSTNKDLIHLKAAWNWGIKFLALPQPNPFVFIAKYPEERKKGYVPPLADFWAIYDVANRQGQIMLLTYLYTGARRTELFRLRWEDVNFGRQEITLYTRKRKGGKMEPDTIPMTDDLFEALLEHRQGANHDHVFISAKTGEPYTMHQHWIKNLCVKAGVKRFSYHAIRRLTASALADANVPMVTIQALLRHHNLQTTERYVQRIADLRPALQVLSKNKKAPEKAPVLKIAK